MEPPEPELPEAAAPEVLAAPKAARRGPPEPRLGQARPEPEPPRRDRPEAAAERLGQRPGSPAAASATLGPRPSSQPLPGRAETQARAGNTECRRSNSRGLAVSARRRPPGSPSRTGLPTAPGCKGLRGKDATDPLKGSSTTSTSWAGLLAFGVPWLHGIADTIGTIVAIVIVRPRRPTLVCFGKRGKRRVARLCESLRPCVSW